jgi:hypothetical protein
MTFRVGQKVVCVDADSGRGGWLRGEELHNNRVYTIASIGIDPSDGESVVELIEVRRLRTHRAPDGWDFSGYAARRFRPIVERKTDISIFTAMLTPEKIGASA